MSNVQAAVKVTDQLIARIFDQRQFTSGEISYLVKEIGDNNNLEGNLDKILRLNQDVCVITDTYKSDLCKLDDNVTKSLLDQVTLTHEKASKLLQIEDEYRKLEEESLEKQREERDKKKQELRRDITLKLEKLNHALVSEELEIERKYLLFEENLRSKV